MNPAYSSKSQNSTKNDLYLYFLNHLDINAFCNANHITFLAVFGSTVRGDTNPDSDIDILVTFKNGHNKTFFDLVELKSNLENRFRKKVDLVSKLNRYLEPYILKDLVVLYEE